MPNHPFLVWLAYNKERDRSVHQAWITVSRCGHVCNLAPQTWSMEQILAFAFADAHPDDHYRIRSSIKHAWAQFEHWQLGVYEDWEEARAQWLEPRK